MAKRQTNLLVKKVVPELNRLGYSKANMLFEEPCQREYTRKFQGEADILVSIKDQPLIVVEIKPRTRDINIAVEEGKLYALNYKPGIIIPYIIAWAGERRQMFKAQITEPFKIDFIPSEHLLSRSEIMSIAEIAKKEVSSEDVLKIETLVTIFEKAYQAIKGIKRPKFSDDEAVLALNRFILGQFHNEDAKQIKVKQLSVNVQKRIEEIFSWYKLTELEGYALASAYRQFVTRNFTGKGYGVVDTRRTGRYLTPAPIIDFMIKLVRLLPSDKVIDFACGSGGFLGEALIHLRDKVDYNSYLRCNIFACDVDEFSVFTSRTYLELLLPGKQEGLNIFHHNGLFSQKVHDWEDDLTRVIPNGSFDVIVSNPPGGTNYGLSDENEIRNIYQFETKKKQLQNGPLFVQRAIQLAKQSGRICLIVPDGILSSAQLRYLQKYILSTCQVKAVVSLPRGVFPHVPSKMSILYMIKTGKPSLKRPIFMAGVRTGVNPETGEEYNLETELEEILEEYRKVAR